METFRIVSWVLLIVIILFELVSVGLFIKDGKASEKEGRDRNKACTVLFIIGMTVAGLIVVGFILLCILAALAMRSM